MKSKDLILMVLLNFLLAPTVILAAQFQFTPRTSAMQEYTDNVFLSEDNEREDYTTVLSAGFTAELLGQNRGIELSYDPAYVFYRNFDENDGWRHNARLLARSGLTERTTLAFVDRFFLTEDPLGEEDLVRDGSIVIEGDTTSRRTREKYYSNTAIASFRNQFGIDDELYGSFLYGLLRNDDPEVQDNDRYQSSIGLNYYFGPEFGVETIGTYTKGKFKQDSGFTATPTDDFDNWFGSIRVINSFTRNFSIFGQYNHTYRNYDGDNEDDYMIYAPSAGFRYSMPSRTPPPQVDMTIPELSDIRRPIPLFEDFIFTLGLGYFYQEIDGDEDEKGYFVNGEINKAWNFRRGLINLTGASGLEQNDFGAENLGLERFVSIRALAGYNFTSNFLGNIFGSYRYSDIVNSESAGGIEEEIQYRFGADLVYMPFNWMVLRLKYSFNRLDQDGGPNYDVNRVAFTIALQPDQPWRF